MTDVVKNIYTFANILSASHTDCVKHWDQHSIRNALRWAKYCMKVEEETRQKSFRDDLDKQIQLMTILLKPVSLLHLSADKLRDASLLICKSLTQNPDTSAEILKVLEEEESNSLQNLRPTKPNRLEPGNRLYQFVGEDVSFMEQSLECQAEHIMCRLVGLQRICLFSQQRYESFLRKVVTELQKYTHGWTLVLYMFLTEVKNEEDYDIVTGIKFKMLQIVSEMASKNFDCGLWQCERTMLCKVSMCDSRFYDMYIEHLLCWAQDMVPIYGLFENGDIYRWRHKDNDLSHIYTYNELQKHLQSLFQIKMLRIKVEQILTDYSEQTFFNIFKDLLKLCCL